MYQGSTAPVWLRRNAALLALIGLGLLLLACSCSSTGSTAADKALELMAPRGFMDKLWDFVKEIAFPALVGVVVVVFTGGTGLFPVAAGTTAAAGTSYIMRPDPKPSTVSITEVHLKAESGSNVKLDTSSPDLSKVPAIEDGMQQQIEHYGFWILLAYVIYLRREWLLAWINGHIQGAPVSRGWALVHALKAGPESREKAMKK